MNQMDKPISAVDPDGLREFSVVFTDRSLNHMSRTFQDVMRDINVLNGVTGEGVFQREQHSRKKPQKQSYRQDKKQNSMSARQIYHKKSLNKRPRTGYPVARVKWKRCDQCGPIGHTRHPVPSYPLGLI